MNIITIIMLAFSIIGGIDRILGNKFGLGKEFEKGLMFFGSLALSMIGMLVLTPVMARLMMPFLHFMQQNLHTEPSVIPVCIFAIDMGGASLAKEIASSDALGLFNGLVVSSMMGATICFTLPYCVTVVEKSKERFMFLGLLCGIITIPIGCLAGGLIAGMSLLYVLSDILPLIIFAIIVSLGLVFCPELSIKVFRILGIIMKIIITIGLLIGIVEFLTGYAVIDGCDSMENAALICLNASIILTGAFPLLKILSSVLARPLKLLSGRLGINDVSAMGFISSLATCVTTFEMMNRMDEKGVVLNSAFAVSAAFALSDHIAFTLAFDASYIKVVVISKIISGVLAVALGYICIKRMKNFSY